MRTCNVCGETKSLGLDFAKVKGYAGGYRPTCRLCVNKRKNELRSGWSKKAVADQQRKYAYGLTPEAYDNMVREQDNKCKLCLEEMIPPHVDHCHETKKVRGLLCKLCNAALGQFKDDPIRIARAVAYLEQARV